MMMWPSKTASVRRAVEALESQSLAEKLCGAAAEEKQTLKEVADVCRKAKELWAAAWAWR